MFIINFSEHDHVACKIKCCKSNMFSLNVLYQIGWCKGSRVGWVLGNGVKSSFSEYSDIKHVRLKSITRPVARRDSSPELTLGNQMKNNEVLKTLT